MRGEPSPLLRFCDRLGSAEVIRRGVPGLRTGDQGVPTDAGRLQAVLWRKVRPSVPVPVETCIMKNKKKYWEAVRWVAENDNAGNGDSEDDIAGYVTTLLVADLFDVDNKQVAADIVTERRSTGLTVGGILS
mgnify:CR=1 FL=1